MCCFVLILGFFGPRLAFLFTWLFSNRVTLAFASAGSPWDWVVPVMGLVFLPWTALMYVLAFAPIVGVSTLGWFFVGLGLLLDILTYSSRAAQRRYESGTATV